MNVPMCALTSILRANGYYEVEPDRICIDEKMLTVFADAYIRKMRNYFLSSIRNIESLTYEEFTDFDEFYNSFKKQEVKFVRRAEWSQIDTELIRTAFIDKIKKLTSHKKTSFELLFEHIIEESDSFFSIKESRPSLSGKAVADFSNLDSVLSRIIHNRFYLTRQKIKKISNSSVDVLRHFFVAARYHIFTVDDTDSDDIICNKVSFSSMYNYHQQIKYEQRKVNSKY